MNNPDFSQSPEHVALAKVLLEAWRSQIQNLQWERWLHTADAAITHLGSGYRLPEATGANAERLGVALQREGWPKMKNVGLRGLLRALHAAFTEPAEKPEPATEQKCNCADCNPANWPETNGWRCGKKPEPVSPGMPAPDRTPCTATSGDHRCELDAGHEGLHESGRIDWEDEPRSEEGPGPDFAAEAAARERNRLIEAFMHDLVGNPAVMAKMLEFYGNDCDAEIGARVAYMAHAFAKEIR